MGDSSRWLVEFYDFLKVPTGLTAEDRLRLDAIHERARGNGARHGTPILVTADGRTDTRLNLFFRTGAMAAARPSTWRRYAHALVVWLDFLEVLGLRWDEATSAEVEVFKDWRLTDMRNPGRVQATSFDTDRAALNSFYAWAWHRYGVANPVPSPGRTPPSRPRERGDAGFEGRDSLRPAGSRRRQVKWLLRRAFDQWRDIGLRGYGFDGLPVAGRRGYHEDRDVAFAEGLYGTGLRLQEWASVLDVEIPGHAGRLPKAWLAAACSKGGRHGRVYRVPRRVLSAVAEYVDPVSGSRAEVIGRAQRAGRYERLANIRVVTGFNAQSRLLFLEQPGRAEPVSVDVVGPDERRVLFRRTTRGLEPLGLWLSSDGMPKQAHSWEDTFADANERIKRQWVAAGGRDQEVPLFCRPHMCRHSFALKWFCILSVVWERRLDGFSEQEWKDLRDQFGDIWYQLASLLGHADPQTTRDHYLEPFTSLRNDYLFAVLDADEQVAVDALIRAVTADSDLVLQGGSSW